MANGSLALARRRGSGPPPQACWRRIFAPGSKTVPAERRTAEYARRNHSTFSSLPNLPRAEPFDGARDVVEREDLIDASRLNGLVRHAEDDGGLRRLGDGAAAAFADAADRLCAVVAHAGHDDGDHPFAAGVA